MGCRQEGLGAQSWAGPQAPTADLGRASALRVRAVQDQKLSTPISTPLPQPQTLTSSASLKPRTIS